MSATNSRNRLGVERLQIAHKIAELNKAFGAIPRGAQGSSSIGREIAKLLARQAELEAQFEQGAPPAEPAPPPPTSPAGPAVRSKTAPRRRPKA